MDEALKALMLLNSVFADVRALDVMKSRGIDMKDLWNASAEGIAGVVLTQNAVSRLRQNEASGWAEREYERCLSLGTDIVAYGGKRYPKQLCDLKDAPLILYWRGKARSLPAASAAAVGTRGATPYGKRVARSIGEECARCGIGLVSGGALGIDAYAHMGSCSAGGPTFAVFGNGVNIAFPRQNRDLFCEICEHGALISEFPLDTQGEAWHFPRRNRIVAALAERLIVVEAPVKSGAMITARIALDLGREVWAVLGHIDEETAGGSNRLIYDGAYPYISADVFFGSSHAVKHAVDTEDLAPDEAAVFALLRASGGRTVDNIAQEAKMSPADILKTVAVLSAKGIVYCSGPGRFSAKV